jgi:hypothetical protein
VTLRIAVVGVLLVAGCGKPPIRPHVNFQTWRQEVDHYGTYVTCQYTVLDKQSKEITDASWVERGPVCHANPTERIPLQ